MPKLAAILDLADGLSSNTSALQATKFTFSPGKLGLAAHLWEHNPRVDHITKGGQAEQKGVKKGMLIVKVNGHPYTQASLHAAMAGENDFNVEFLTEEMDE